MAFTLKDRHRGERLNKLLLAAVRLFNGDRQVAAVRGWVQIINFKRAWLNKRTVNHVVVLLNGNFGVAFGNTADNGRKPALTVRQHFFIRG